jgi:hypothetical protein
MPEKEYLLFLDIDVRKRHAHKIESGKITEFVVQLEIKLEDKWRVVIRYDCAHGFAHKDCYNRAGHNRKINLYPDYDDALTLADDDINDNWEKYKDRFLKGGFP